MIRYSEIETTAAKIWLGQRLYSLQIDVTKLKYDQPVLFDTMQHYCTLTNDTLTNLRRHKDTQDGLTICRKKQDKPLYLVLYNDEMKNLRRRNFTLAHEIGHIYLGHQTDEEKQEQEANYFALQLLMPRVLADAYLSRVAYPATPVDLCAVFSVSRQAAAYYLRSRNRSLHTSDSCHMLLSRFERLLPSVDGPVVTF